jgi:uncharacterized protein
VNPDTLTPFERQTLINQFRILAKLEPESATDYEDRIRILAAGYSIRYGEVFEVLEEMNLADCRYVYDVLDMYRILKYSFEKLKDKEGLTEEDVKFRGFDGNNESKRYAFISYLRDEKLWAETLQEGGRLNSHSQITMSLYPRMLSVYTPIWESKDHISNDYLTAAEIKKIVGKD